MAKKRKNGSISEEINNANSNIRPNINEKYDFKYDNNIIFDFGYEFSFYSCCIKSSNFSNKLKDEKEFLDKNRKIFKEIVPMLSNMKKEEILIKNQHCHKIENDKIDIVKKILKKINSNEEKVDQIIEGEMVYQLGINQGLRVVGIFNFNIFRVLFIDYHHLLYPSIKHNNKDFFKLKYCPMNI